MVIKWDFWSTQGWYLGVRDYDKKIAGPGMCLLTAGNDHGVQVSGRVQLL